MTVAGQTSTQALAVLRDPRILAGASDLAASTAAQIRVRDDINRTVAMINRLEVMRKQIEDLRKANAGKKPAEQALGDLEKKMMDVELQLITRTEMRSDDKWYVEAYVYDEPGVVERRRRSGAGDVQGGADYWPRTRRCRCWK
jgi:hypothetical protein